MRMFLLPIAALLTPASLLAETRPALSPPEIVAAAPASDWVRIAPADLLVMDLAPTAAGKPRRVVIQLLPAPFAQGWTGNIRKLAAARFWDGTAVVRVQDNYVTQWGDPDAEDKAKARKLPDGLAVMAESAYTVDQIDIQLAQFGEERTPESEAQWRKDLSSVKRAPPPEPRRNPDIIGTRTRSAPDGWHERDAYAPYVQFHAGWPLGTAGKKADARFWPVHCYGMVGAGRNMSPDTGTGAELYAVIGHAPRHLDRNIALVGRVIEGIEHLSSLPRGTGPLGFYETAQERTAITAVRLGTELADLPGYEYLSTESASFARYADARANRRDAFFIRPAGGADICNIPVPVRRAK